MFKRDLFKECYVYLIFYVSFGLYLISVFEGSVMSSRIYGLVSMEKYLHLWLGIRVPAE